MAEGILIAQCRCGVSWEMDNEQAPEGCYGEVWRLGVLDGDALNWGCWVDSEGNYFVEEPNGNQAD